MIIDVLASLLLLTGAAFALLGSVGLARFPDLLTRLHGPSKATTLGIGGLLLASMLWFSAREGGVSLHELLITLFLVITTPVSAMFVARASRVGAEAETVRQPPESP